MNKAQFFAAAFLFAAGTAAQAADLPAKAPAAVAPTYAPYNWTGLYLGVNAGGGWGDHTTKGTLAGATLFNINTKPDGFIGGGQIGYNWQASNWVFGVEADIQGADQKGTAKSAFTVLGVPLALTATEKLTYFGTVRGRVGYAWNRQLLYFTGGWAYGHESASATVTGPGISVTGSGSQDMNNGWTVGGGWEWAFADRWSARIEYLYIDFGSDSGGTTATAIPGVGTLAVTTNHFTDNVVRAGLNYKLW